MNKSGFKIRLIFGLSFSECLQLLEIFQNVFAVRELVNLNAKSSNASDNVRIEESISKSNLISKAILSLSFL